jgi:hypothetical protein
MEKKETKKEVKITNEQKDTKQKDTKEQIEEQKAQVEKEVVTEETKTNDTKEQKVFNPVPVNKCLIKKVIGFIWKVIKAIVKFVMWISNVIKNVKDIFGGPKVNSPLTSPSVKI